MKMHGWGTRAIFASPAIFPIDISRSVRLVARSKVSYSGSIYVLPALIAKRWSLRIASKTTAELPDPITLID